MHALAEKISLIIPCYNEAERLKLDVFLDSSELLKFLFVNDGSTDHTGDLIRAHLNERMFLRDLPKNVGKAEAVRLGMLYASETSPLNDSEWIGYWDADLATPLSEINNFLTYAYSYEFPVESIWGSRVYRLGSSIRRSYRRHVLGRMFATFTGVFLGIQSYDSQCGAKLFRKSLIRCAFSDPFMSKWIFDVELLMRLQHTNIIEYPLRTWSDVSGSKVRILPNMFRILADLIRIKTKYGFIEK